LFLAEYLRLVLYLLVKFVLLPPDLPFYLNFFDAEGEVDFVKSGKFWLRFKDVKFPRALEKTGGFFFMFG